MEPMADLTDYERRGDLSAPFELTKSTSLAQKQALSIRESVRCDVPRLTWEEYAAGEPCPAPIPGRRAVGVQGHDVLHRRGARPLRGSPRQLSCVAALGLGITNDALFQMPPDAAALAGKGRGDRPHPGPPPSNTAAWIDALARAALLRPRRGEALAFQEHDASLGVHGLL